MPSSPNGRSGADAPPSAGVPEDLSERLSELDESQLRNVASYVRSLLPPPPDVTDLLEERQGEKIHRVTPESGYTAVVKSQQCPEGCADCPHGPYLYHVRAESSSPEDEGPTLHWEFIGPVE